MRKLKTNFKLDVDETEKMKKKSLEWGQDGTFIGVYKYKDCTIYHSIVKGLKYCSVSREGNKNVSDSIIEEVANYFIGKNYEVTPSETLFGALAGVTNIWEIKLNA